MSDFKSPLLLKALFFFGENLIDRPKVAYATNTSTSELLNLLFSIFPLPSSLNLI